MMLWLRFSVCILLASFLSADEFSYIHRDGDSIYTRAINDVTHDDDILDREKRQAGSYEYNVTQCNYDNTICCDDVASIQVLGKNLQYSNSAQQAAKLVHRMVRFMPRSLFVNITKTCKIGLFSTNDFPLPLFDEFIQMPSACMTSCSLIYLQNGTTYDCSQWCTTDEYPFDTNFPLNFLWSYGNVSRMYVVESNVICQGFNPAAGENLLMREFGLMLMTRVFDNNLLSRIEEAYQHANVSGNWGAIKNKYHYFMKATQIWFDGITTNAGVMPCLHIRDINNKQLCEDLYAQRMNVKILDEPMFDILNYVFNDRREGLESWTSVCDW